MGPPCVATVVRALAVLLVLLPLALPGADADECARDVSLYSKRPPMPSYDAPSAGVTAGACVVVYGQYVGDVRYLVPDATEVTVVVHRDLGVGVPTITVTLDGLGFTADSFTMTRMQTLRTDYAYRMPFVAIPDAPTQGTLTVTVSLPGETIVKTYTAP